jgi:hypothetical protein
MLNCAARSATRRRGASGVKHVSRATARARWICSASEARHWRACLMSSGARLPVLFLVPLGRHWAKRSASRKGPHSPAGRRLAIVCTARGSGLHWPCEHPEPPQPRLPRPARRAHRRAHPAHHPRRRRRRRPGPGLARRTPALPGPEFAGHARCLIAEVRAAFPRGFAAPGPVLLLADGPQHL